MNSDFIHIKAVTDGKEYYIKVDQSDGAKIILPGVGTVALSADDISKIVDFRAGFDYNDTLIRRRKVRTIQPDTLEYNVLNEETNELVLVSFVLNTHLDQPEMIFECIKVADGKQATRVKLPFTVVDVLLHEFAAKGFESELPVINDIKYVDKLPNETAAESDKVYLFEKEYYKLNADEDGYNKVTGPFVQVNTLPEFTPKAKAGVLYNLTADWVEPNSKDKYTKGIYTFDATTKAFTLTDLKTQSVRALPEVDKATANVIYVLTKDDGERGKGTEWVVKENAWVEETREIVSGNTLPIIPLAVTGTYYIVSGKQMQLAEKSTFKNLGTIKDVKALPDTTKLELSGDVVYVLTKAQDSYKVGDKFIFDTETKEFGEYSDESTGEAGGEGMNG